jgi:hypothetical protein
VAGADAHGARGRSKNGFHPAAEYSGMRWEIGLPKATKNRRSADSA